MEPETKIILYKQIRNVNVNSELVKAVRVDTFSSWNGRNDRRVKWHRTR